MRLKLLACNVFLREVCLCAARSPHVLDLEFTELGEHAQPEKLRESLQKRIDAIEEAGRDYAAVLLAYGLCGNATAGLRARSRPLVLPRAHDCCTVLLGSRAAFQEYFGANPSMPFGSAGYLERGDYGLCCKEGETRVVYGDQFQQLVEQYGEENARYIYETLHPHGAGNDHCAVFIEIPELAHLGHAEEFRKKADAEGREFVRLTGSLRLLEKFVNGDWDSDFLVVPPGRRIAGVYDMEEVVRAAE